MTKPIDIPGLIRGESNADYHANLAVSNSGLKKFNQRPSLFKKHFDGLVKQEETPSMAIGTATHTLVLEPDLFAAQYEVLPEDFNARTNDGKGLMKKIEAEGKTPLKHDAYRDLVEYRESVMANPVARALLAQGEAELTWRLRGATHSLQCRTDWMCFAAPLWPAMEGEGNDLPAVGEPYTVDFKTTQALDDWCSDGWNNPVFKFGYDRQLVFYRLVMNVILKNAGLPTVERFYFVVAEKQEPRECAVFAIDTDTLEAAMATIMDDLNRLARCFETGVWPGFRQDVVLTGIADRVRDSRALEAMNSRRMLNEPEAE